MKHHFALFAFIIAFSSCNKIPDYIKDRYQEEKKKFPCRLLAITSFPNPDSSSTKIYYDSKGRPAYEDRTLTNQDGYLFHYKYDYAYDAKGRLLSTKQPFIYPVVWLEHRYIYAGNNPLPIGDTALHLFDIFFMEYFTYDQKGRIVEVKSQELGDGVNKFDTTGHPIVVSEKYYYDSNGNRQLAASEFNPNPELIRYSIKPSLYSLHPVWRLTHRNWSKSYPDYPDEFNEQGFVVKANRDENHYTEFLTPSQHNVLTYDCSPPPIRVNYP